MGPDDGCWRRDRTVPFGAYNIFERNKYAAGDAYWADRAIAIDIDGLLQCSGQFMVQSTMCDGEVCIDIASDNGSYVANLPN